MLDRPGVFLGVQIAKSRATRAGRVRKLSVPISAQRADWQFLISADSDGGVEFSLLATLDTARAAYIRLLSSLGSNAEVRAEVTCFCEQLDQMQLRMLDPKPRKRPTTSSPSTHTR
jgi:hypothetical protein